MLAGELLAGRFLLERQAASGGMGTVFVAKDTFTGDRVAVKTVGAKVGLVAERFMREVRVLADLSHPAIVRYIAHGEVPEGLYLVMEWLDGESLEARLSRGPLSVRDALSLAERVARALGFAHRSGVVHRDVTPANIFLRGGRLEGATLIDFGVARLEDAHVATHSGITLGTPGYMAPEQARGAHEVDARADVFAMGCVLFECVTGTPPFAGAHVMAVLAKILLEEAPRASELCPEVPFVVDQLLMRVLSKDPAGRPSDGLALSAELRDVMALASAGEPSVDPKRDPGTLTNKEQRLVSVLLAGGNAFTSARPSLIVERPPPEVEGRVATIRSLLRPSAAHVEVLADGSVMATMMGGGNASDQVARAARAALSVREVLPTLPLVLVTGRGVLRGQLPIGDAIDDAVSLLRAEVVRGLAPGQQQARRPICIDEATAGLLDARFVTASGDAGPTLVGERQELAPRTLLGRRTPFVGRAREMAELVACFDETARGSVANAVLVTGPTGVGKTRLCFELLTVLPSRGEVIELWEARGDPIRRGAPLGLLSQIVRRACGIVDAEPQSSGEAKLRARLARAGRSVPDRGLVEYLGELCQLPFSDADNQPLRAARQDPITMGTHLRHAVQEWLALETSLGPVVLMIDDLQWGDQSSLNILDDTLRRLHDRPLIVFAAGRPEVHNLFPDLWRDRGVHEVRLAPLDAEGCDAIARAMLGDRVPKATIERIIDRSNGNPHFLEELIRAVEAGRGEQLPWTVLAVIQARLESLHGDARRVLRAASIFGKVFRASGVAALLGEQNATDTLRKLAELELLELVTSRELPQSAADREYEFRDALVREAAYGMLTEADSALGHRLAGEYLERRGERSAVVLGEHFERGGVPDRAAACYERAAVEALEGNDFASVLAWTERAEMCLSPRPLSGMLWLLRAEANRWIGLAAEAEEAALEAMVSFSPGELLWCRAVGEAVTSAGRVGHTDDLVKIAEHLANADPTPHGDPAVAAHIVARARAVMQLLWCGRGPQAEELLRSVGQPDQGLLTRYPEVRAWLSRARSLRALFAGFPAAHARLVEVALAAFEQAGDLRNACIQQMNIGYSQIELGNNGDAELRLLDVITRARLHGLPDVEVLAKHNLGVVLARRAAYDESRATLRETLSSFSTKGNRRFEGVSRIYLSLTLAQFGDLKGARREAERAVKAVDPFPPAMAHALSNLAHVMLLQGENDAALDRAREARSLLDVLGGIEEGESMVRLVHAEALYANDLSEEGDEALREADNRLAFRAEHIADRSTRLSFLRGVPDNARTVTKARERLGKSATDAL